MSAPNSGMEMEVESSSASEGSKTLMDTAQIPTKNVMASGTVGSVTCSLHPLVIMNVSEHWTRERAQEGVVQQGMH